MVIPSQCGSGRTEGAGATLPANTSPFVPTRVERRGGEIGKLTAMLNFIERKKAFVLVALLAAAAVDANELVSYQLAAGLPLKHDGYIVERRGTGNGERVRFVVKAQTARAFLYANYESNRWMNARSYPFVRDPHFKTRALDVSRSPEPLRDWIAATGANTVYFKRGRPNARRLRECAALGVDAYSFLYGCDAAKWNRARYEEFVAAHPSAKGVSSEKSWEKGTLCPSDAATAAFFGEAVREIAVPEVAGVVVCLWDYYGLNCVCDRCKANGFAGNWGRQVAFAVKAWEDALKPLKKKLIVRTWSSGASHWLGDEWVHAPGYGGPSGEPLSVWGEAMRRAGTGVLFQTKVYNADCQPNPPFSALLQVAPRRDIAEWQITGFAKNVARRESLLRYTNRYFLPEGKSALEPTQENVARVIAQKDAAIAALDAAVAGLGKDVVADADLVRFGWLRSHLVASRELDANLWRLRLLKRELRHLFGKDASEVSASEAEAANQLLRDAPLRSLVDGRPHAQRVLRGRHHLRLFGQGPSGARAVERRRRDRLEPRIKGRAVSCGGHSRRLARGTVPPSQRQPRDTRLPHPGADAAQVPHVHGRPCLPVERRDAEQRVQRTRRAGLLLRPRIAGFRRDVQGNKAETRQSSKRQSLTRALTRPHGFRKIRANLRRQRPCRRRR